MRQIMGGLGFFLAMTAIGQPSRTEVSRGLFATVLQHPALTETLRAMPGSELIGIRQFFVPAGRGSHTDVEVTYGVPDEIGGYRSTSCLMLKLASDGSMPGNDGRPNLVTSEERCSANQ